MPRGKKSNGQTPQDQAMMAAALKRLELLQKQEAFDPLHPASRPTLIQNEVISDFGHIRQQWIRAGNQSGKSSTCARLLAWFMTETHPTWKRPKEWVNEPFLAIVAGRTGKQIEDSLLPKIRGFFEPGTFKEVRIGNIIQRIEFTNGNRIIFQSLENPNVARERLQSYTAHFVWVDELPPTMDIVRELLIRVQARNGYFLASFTPTVVAVEIQKYVDQLKQPEGKVYRFNMLDNPLYSDPKRKEELLARYANLPDHIKQAIFQGEWLSADDQVYYFDWNTMVDFPIGYSPMWRHVESVDPAISSALGLTIWAENPETGIWYCITAEYIKGVLVPDEIVQTVQKYTKNLNIVRRTSDYAPWYTNTAAKLGIHYQTVDSKNQSRKPELIKQLQQALGSRIRISPTCERLIDEFQECRWSGSKDGKIANSSTFHLLDSAQYFVDCIPKQEARVKFESFHAHIYEQNEKRKLAQYKKEVEAVKKIERRTLHRRNSRWK
jgi:phage terminase large subunit-like protein